MAQSTTTPWNTGGTIPLNGTRFSLPTMGTFAPANYVQQASSVPAVGPNVPPAMMSGTLTTGGTTSGLQETVGGYGTAANNGTTTAIAHANPWNYKVSPLVWILLFGIVGLVGLRYISWRKVVESGSESVRVGPASESAKEEI